VLASGENAVEQASRRTFFSAGSVTSSQSVLRALRICEAATEVDVFSKACFKTVSKEIQLLQAHTETPELDEGLSTYHMRLGLAVVTRSGSLGLEVRGHFGGGHFGNNVICGNFEKVEY
jgi:hypothetical protein